MYSTTFNCQRVLVLKESLERSTAVHYLSRRHIAIQVVRPRSLQGAERSNMAEGMQLVFSFGTLPVCLFFS